ncbi:hypothetical protein [Solidesulfovibrio alcoholivorans]|uniref:hypothetical protein n=1 Tax=Solidesulfovibrio alcoholivorans TaxID=81406 RepID=UPI000497750B|nr:hypothetical protein [Solidesulfovibrio alcoholivorans]
MTLADLKRRLPPRTLGYLVVGALLAGAFLALFIIPDSHKAKELAVEIGQLRAALEVRRQMLPVLQSLNKARASLPAVDATEKPGRLPLSDVGRLAAIMDDLAAPSGVRMTRVSPDPASVTRGGLLAVRLGMLGEPDKFREFLLALGRFAPLVRIESVSTVVGGDGREYAVKCWLGVQ